MQLISATSWNNTLFYYNSDKGKFDMANAVDLSANDHYECDEQTLESAISLAEKNGLKNIKLETISEQK